MRWFEILTGDGDNSDLQELSGNSRFAQFDEVLVLSVDVDGLTPVSVEVAEVDRGHLLPISRSITVPSGSFRIVQDRSSSFGIVQDWLWFFGVVGRCWGVFEGASSFQFNVVLDWRILKDLFTKLLKQFLGDSAKDSLQSLENLTWWSEIQLKRSSNVWGSLLDSLRIVVGFWGILTGSQKLSRIFEDS